MILLQGYIVAIYFLEPLCLRLKSFGKFGHLFQVLFLLDLAMLMLLLEHDAALVQCFNLRKAIHSFLFQLLDHVLQMLLFLSQLELLCLYLGDQFVSILQSLDEVKLLCLKSLNCHLLLADECFGIFNLIFQILHSSNVVTCHFKLL